MTHTWNDAYRWMLEWGGEVGRAHLLDKTAPPVRFSGLEGITALWAEKGSGYDYVLLNKPDAGTAFAEMYVEAGGVIVPALGKYGPTLISPPGGSPVPKGPFDGSIWGWVEPGSKAPDEAGTTPASDEKSCTPDLKPGDLKDDAQPTETYWKDLCAKLRRELNEAIEDNEGLRDELLDTLRELRRRVK